MSYVATHNDTDAEIELGSVSASIVARCRMKSCDTCTAWQFSCKSFWTTLDDIVWCCVVQCRPMSGGTAAAAPPPFRPSDPALCGSRPLVTPYYSRLGDLLCLFCVYRFVCHYCLCICVFSCFRCFLSLL